MHYITAEKCIALANEVFGFNGWSSSIKVINVDFCDEHPQTLKISLGLSVIVRVTLRDGTYHEDIGYGHIENCSGKAKAFEKAKKEGTTDALKRALRNFGNVLGNCIYDKDYVKKVTKLKVQPNRTWDENGLHRHADYVKKEEVKVEPGVRNGGPADTSMIPAVSTVDSFEDLLAFEFDEVDFNMVDEEDHPDEVIVPPSEKPAPQNNTIKPITRPMQPPSRPLGRSQSAGNQLRAPQTPANQVRPRPGPHNHQNQAVSRPQQMNQTRPNGAPSNSSNFNSGGPHQTPPPHAAGKSTAAATPESVGFFSARAVKQITGTKEEEAQNLPAAPLGAQAFNPHAETPSIRRTPGIDHSRSKPLSVDGKHALPIIQPEDGDDEVATAAVGGLPSASKAGSGATVGLQQQTPLSSQRGNIINPQFNQTRRIGAPTGPASPSLNRSSYRPPTFKRPALSEVSTNGAVTVAVGGAVGGDPKRQKMG